MNLQQFVTELRARGVYRVAAIYSAGAWALLQIADVIFPILDLPDWSVTAVLLAAAAGFPVAIIISWLFDMTPEGLVEAPAVTTLPTRLPLSGSQIIQLTLIVLLIILVGYLYLDRLSPGSASSVHDAPQRTSIAVMPFVNMSGVQRMEYLGDGLAEEILNLLAKLNELDVAARTSSFYFKNKDVDIRYIGEQLGVGHVLEGSIRHDEGRVRVTAQLIDVSNGYHLWSETYDRKLDSMLALQDEIAAKVVDTLQVLLSDESRETLTREVEVDPASYDYYLQGRAYLRLPSDTTNLEFARDLFTKAVNIDSTFADGFAGLCDSLLGLYYNDRDVAQFHEAENACQRALLLDRRAASVYVALGNLYHSSGQYQLAIGEFNTAISLGHPPAEAYLGLASSELQNNDFTLAEENFQKAIAAQPNYWKAYMAMGNYLFETGRVAEAIPYYKRITELMPESASALNNLGAALFLTGDFATASASWQESLRLAPSSTTYSNVATSMYYLERFDEAVELYHKSVEFAPEDYELWGNLGDAYTQLPAGYELATPMYTNAIRLAHKRLDINASDADTLSLIGHYQSRIGERDKALENLDTALALAPGNMIVWVNSAVAFARLGEWTRSLDALERALELGYPWQLTHADASLKELRNMPRYEALSTQYD